MPVVRGASGVTYTFGPGPPSAAVRLLLIATIGAFGFQLIAGFLPGLGADPLVRSLDDSIIQWLGMTPALVLRGYVWQMVTYMFLHAGPMHLLFNMLALWMFGVDLEHRWGRTAFFRYYFVCGIGAALTCIAAAYLPFDGFRYVEGFGGFRTAVASIPTVGASGAIYGLLLAYGMLFPHRIIYLLVFPVPSRIYVIIVGVIVLAQSLGGGGAGVAHFAHLGGLIFGYLYLSLGRGGPWAEIKYRYVKWRMNRLRKRFDVHDGGRRWDSRVH